MTAVEWLEKEFIELEHTIGVHFKMYELIDKAKEMENQQQDDYAIEFAQWINNVSYRSFDNNWYLTQIDEDIKKTTEEMLEIFKKEKGL